MGAFILIMVIVVCFSVLQQMRMDKLRKKMNAKKTPLLKAEALKGNIEAGKELYFLINSGNFKVWLDESKEILGEQVTKEMQQAIVIEIVRISATLDLFAKIDTNFK